MLKVTMESDRPLVALVDDEKEITELLSEELKGDYEVIQFNNPQKFVEAVKSKVIRPAVLVIDLKMPVLNGLETLKQINDAGVNIPTIMFSGYLDKDDAISALELGVIHIIEKPVDIEIVHEIVNDSLIDWELMKTRQDIRDLTKQVKELYSTLRMAVGNYVAPELVDKIFVGANGNNESFDILLETLEEKLEFLMREENLLAKMKQTQYRKALEKQAQRAS
jgi:FixJ family two-component response regulator